MAYIEFYSVTALKEDSIVNENVDTKVIAPIIKVCQQTYILPMLGTGLYNDIVTKLTADITLAAYPTTKTLLDDYIQPCLKWWIQTELPIALSYKYSNKGIQVASGDNSTNASMDDLIKLMEMAKDKAQWYSERLTYYLLANTVTFPLFDNPGNTIDTIVPRKNNYTKGIYLGGDQDYFGMETFSDREHYMKKSGL